MPDHCAVLYKSLPAAVTSVPSLTGTNLERFVTGIVTGGTVAAPKRFSTQRATSHLSERVYLFLVHAVLFWWERLSCWDAPMFLVGARGSAREGTACACVSVRTGPACSSCSLFIVGLP